MPGQSIAADSLRKYGSPPFTVAVIHGGPGAPGSMAPVARELSAACGVLEPLQTAKSVDGQVEELRQVLTKHADLPIVLIGHSWGAWLCFILAARHPEMVKKLVLVSSGPFEEKYAWAIIDTRLGRMTGEEVDRLREITKALNKPEAGNDRKTMAELGLLMSKVDTYKPLSDNKQEGLLEACPEIFRAVWGQAEELRHSGELMKMGTKIQCPVVAIHGDYDPHPAAGVKEPLERTVKDFKLIPLERCGHEPWKERHARDQFYEVLRAELKD